MSTTPRRPRRIGHATAESIRWYAHTLLRTDGYAGKPRNVQRTAISRRGWYDFSRPESVTDAAIAALRAYDHDIATGTGGDWYAADAQIKTFRRRHGYEPGYSREVNQARLNEIFDGMRDDALLIDRARQNLPDARAYHDEFGYHTGPFAVCRRFPCTGFAPEFRAINVIEYVPGMDLDALAVAAGYELAAAGRVSGSCKHCDARAITYGVAEYGDAPAPLCRRHARPRAILTA